MHLLSAQLETVPQRQAGVRLPSVCDKMAAPLTLFMYRKTCCNLLKYSSLVAVRHPFVKPNPNLTLRHAHCLRTWRQIQSPVPARGYATDEKAGSKGRGAQPRGGGRFIGVALGLTIMATGMSTAVYGYWNIQEAKRRTLQMPPQQKSRDGVLPKVDAAGVADKGSAVNPMTSCKPTRKVLTLELSKGVID